MEKPNISNLRQQLQRTVGPTPWYWKTFSPFVSEAGQRFAWTHQRNEGPLAYLISLVLDHEPDKPRLALNRSGPDSKSSSPATSPFLLNTVTLTVS